MHACVFVITTDGTNPAALMLGRDLGWHGTIDWAAAGGRWTGLLQPKPGATTAKVFGDAIPSFEATVLGWIAGNTPSVSAGHAGRQVRNGVDQLSLRELDGFAVPGWVLTPDGQLHGIDLTPEEYAAGLAEDVGVAPPVFGEARQSLDEKTADWGELVDALLAAWLERDTTVTVVDVHA